MCVCDQEESVQEVAWEGGMKGGSLSWRGLAQPKSDSAVMNPSCLSRAIRPR